MSFEEGSINATGREEKWRECKRKGGREVKEDREGRRWEWGW